MRKLRFGAALLLALGGIGCVMSNDMAGDLNDLYHYGHEKPEQLRFHGVSWGVLDKLEKARMLVVPL